MDNPLKNIYYYSDSSRKLLIGIILLWISTLIHHLYGAYIYNTLWRAIAPTLLFPVLLIFTIKLFKNFIGTPKYWQKIFFTSTIHLLHSSSGQRPYGKILPDCCFLFHPRIFYYHATLTVINARLYPALMH